ncbi:MAG: hypothetical protein ACREBE_05990, partial [bacterium]
PEPLADFTLAGPTSSAWFDHWHDFLEREHVRFDRGKLVGFDMVGGAVVPCVAGTQATGDHYVLALSLREMAELVPSFLAAAAKLTKQEELKLENMKSLLKFAGDIKTLETDTPNGPLQHLSGIQFYFDQDVRFWRGHTQYLDSSWGLTSIAQPQFWARARTPEDDYRSILSVDIGIFNRPHEPAGKPALAAWQCSAQQIAEYVWDQIYQHHDDAFKQRYGKHAQFPKPTAYALDATISFGRHASTESAGPVRETERDPGGGLKFQSPRLGAVRSNSSPFLVNRTGAYPTRPGRLNTGRDGSKCISLYDVIARRYVLAGTYMQTFTRLTSMEAANESARHAVNAFLQYWEIGGDRCDIWDPEDHELEDLQWFKDLDEKLFDRKLPHFVDILDWDELPADLQHLRAFAERFMNDRRGVGSPR